MKTPEIQQQFRDISKINIISSHKDHLEYEVNEALKLGWQLLLIHTNEGKMDFVMGWPGFSTPPKTNKEKSEGR
jgi:hypothetical protein